MPAQILTDCTVWLHDQDLSGITNQVTLSMEADEQDATTFVTSGYKTILAGLRSVEADVQGFQELTGGVDASQFAGFGSVDHVATLGVGIAEGSRSYAFQASRLNYEAFGAVGDVAPYITHLGSSNTVGIVRGQVAKSKGNVSAVGAVGSVLNLGNVSTGQWLYGGLHLFGTPGTTITVVLESDDSAGFASGTTRATFNGGAITTAGGFWAARTAGLLTETHYRLRVTAITGTWSVAGWIGIQ